MATAGTRDDCHAGRAGPRGTRPDIRACGRYLFCPHAGVWTGPRGKKDDVCALLVLPTRLDTTQSMWPDPLSLRHVDVIGVHMNPCLS